jgi:hypothetical protein
MLSRINFAILSLVTRFNELPYGVQLVLFGVPLIAVIIVGHHFGVLSKGNPGGHIPRSWFY